jgi:endo-1,4-beta-xylanase
MKRREALLKGVQAAACIILGKSISLVAMPDANWPASPLRSAGERLGFQVGTAANMALLQDPAIAQIVVKQFNLLTASGMKWDHIHPAPETYDFAEGDWNMRFAEEHHMQVHGHNLCWNAPAGYPPWFKTVLNKANAKDYLTSHITTVMKRYQGRIDSWDVVNEPIVSWPGRSDGLYPGIWLDLLGPEYLDIAFHTASVADPKALRVLNVHHVEQDTPDNELTRTRVLAWLKQLLSRGVPVQAVGFESHLDASQPLLSSSFRGFVQQIRALGLQVLVTELDVKENRAQGSSHDWDVTAARYYGDYLAEVLSCTTPRSVIFWSPKDRWENGRKIQGLLQNDASPRLTLSSAFQALQTTSSGER